MASRARRTRPMAARESGVRIARGLGSYLSITRRRERRWWWKNGVAGWGRRFEAPGIHRVRDAMLVQAKLPASREHGAELLFAGAVSPACLRHLFDRLPAVSSLPSSLSTETQLFASLPQALQPLEPFVRYIVAIRRARVNRTPATMTEEQELQAKIAALSGKYPSRPSFATTVQVFDRDSDVQRSGRINQHKHSAQGTPASDGYALQQGASFESTRNDTRHAGYAGYGRGRGRGNASNHWAPQRGTPYGSYRGSRGRGYPTVHRNRTLVLNNNAQTDDSTESAPSTPEPSSTPNGTNTWVSKRDRHHQLINASVYNQVSQHRSQAIAETMAQKRKLRDIKEKARLQKHFQYMQAQKTLTVASSALSEPTSSVHEIRVEGLPFRITDGGSKLVRILGTHPSLFATVTS